MGDMTACIFNIQKYSIHDGPGIRTVVFFKGCPLRCPWCSNPESQSTSPQLAWDQDTCTPGETCPQDCPHNGHTQIPPFVSDYSYVRNCPHKALTLYGEYRSIDDLITEIVKDREFYEESGGGVTLSGGEVLMHHGFAAILLRRLKAKGIHTACETTGYASAQVFGDFIGHIDLLLFDLKHYDSEIHYKLTGVHNDRIIENLRGAICREKDVVIRIPVVPGVNDSLEDARGFARLIKELGGKKVNLLPFHQLGQRKYRLLGKDYQFSDTPQLHEEDLRRYAKIFLDSGLDCTT